MTSVAVISDVNGHTASIFEADCVKVFVVPGEKEGWECVRTLPIEIDAQKGLQVVRASVKELIGELGEVKVIAGKKMSGVIYNLFDAAGFAIFEMVGKPERYLDFIKEQLRLDNEEAEKAALQRDAEYPDHPLPTGQENIYAINLVELQKNRPEISSKMALLPFLQNTTFAELNVICSHAPCWFDRTLGEMSLWYEAKQLENGHTSVNIFHAPCNT